MTSLKLDSTPEAEVIRRAVKVLRDGGLLVYPTETVYGLGVDATNQAAVDKLLKFKGQRGRKPILIAVSGEAMTQRYVELNDVARRLYRQFLPGPVAIVSQAKSNTQPTTHNPHLARGIASPEGTVGVRIPDYPLIRAIIRQFGKPITTTSANISGARHPWSIADIREVTQPARLEMIDLALDAGQLPQRPPSTIIDTSREETEIVRQGEVKIIPNAELRMKNVRIQTSNSESETKKIALKLAKELIKNSSFDIRHSTLVFALQGQLGAGKTVFVSGIAWALGITEPIRSPSYTLVREYRLPSSLFFHIDAWRLHSPEEFADLGLEEMLQPGNIIAIEWAGRLAPIIKMIEKKSKLVLVKIEVTSDYGRSIQIAKL